MEEKQLTEEEMINNVRLKIIIILIKYSCILIFPQKISKTVE